MPSVLHWIFLLVFIYSAAEKITYISIEHPRVDFYDAKYVGNISISARRVGRGNPVYYFNLGGNIHLACGNNILMNFYFFEWLTNRYKRGFFEMHYKLCDLLDKEPFFGAEMRRRLNHSCPLPPGYYYFANMTVPPASIPRGFPFTKGRIYFNASLVSTKQNVVGGHVDMEIKQINVEMKHLLSKV